MKLVTIRHQGHRKVGAIRPGTDRIWLLEEMLGRPVGNMLSIIPELDGIKKTATFTGEGIAASRLSSRQRDNYSYSVNAGRQLITMSA